MPNNVFPQRPAPSLPYGEWPSPIRAMDVAAGAKSLSAPRMVGQDCYWLESRASEGGRITLLHLPAGAQQPREITANPRNVRTNVHEYGGGALYVDQHWLIFHDLREKQLMAQALPDGALQALSPPAPALRHADMVLDHARQRVIAVCEDHTDSDLTPVNSLCAIGLPGNPAAVRTVLASGHDFYAAPRISPDGTQLAFLTWDHPRMPWQGSELWLADLQTDGQLANLRKVAGSISESICQPRWSPDGQLYFVSDRSGWWNIYRHQHGESVCILAREAEFGQPDWTFGNSMYGFQSADQIICTFLERGISRLARLDLTSLPARLELIALPYTDISELQVSAHAVLMVAGSAQLANSVVHLPLDGGELTVLASSIPNLPDSGYLSQPVQISYPAFGRTAHAFFYPPRNLDADGSTAGPHQANPGLPPLIVIGHGGPTGMATSSLRLAIQYWTSRGFALLDVNYGGSSGFGRAYRDSLQGQWGVVDVEDCVAGARYLVEQGQVDAKRLIIRGGSAGGFTTLCALMFYDVFKAGASYYGVSDLAGLDADSHKFESHYNQYLIAPPPEAERLYRERSPCNHLDKLRYPMIFFQGQDDKVVPPAQSEIMVQALRERNVPVAYLAFEGEGHGFRRAENILRTLEAELFFYRKVLGMAVDTHSPAPVAIDNLTS